MFHFKDFVPEQTKAGGFFTAADYEHLESTLQKANQWIAQAGAQVFNIETLLLPNIHHEEGSTDTHLRTGGEVGSYWHQVIRVWYEG